FEPWRCCGTPAGALRHPDQLRDAEVEWLPAIVPGTVAATLRAAAKWDISQPLNADDKDWWYHTVFTAPISPEAKCRLCLDGLATLAEVWLNGECVLGTDNMFRGYQLELSPYLRP